MRHSAPLATLLTAATLGLSLAFGADAAACAPGTVPADPVVFSRPPPNSSLLQRAEALEHRASAQELEATQLTREAAALSRRASSLRGQAARVFGEARAELLAFAMRLDRESASVRAAATDARLEAASLRDQAMELRRLARRPPGWRPRPTVAIF
jgi:hypothetical protein